MVLGVALLSFVVSCSAGKTIRSDPSPSSMGAGNGDFIESGVASWYGDDFHGRITANGEVYDMNKLTAAHQTLPFHTLVQVENLENGKKVLVRINDRGPFLKDRVIDLSLRAAQRLDMVEKGTAVVNIRLVRSQGGKDAAGETAAESAVSECCVQFGAFTVRENAEALLPTLAEILPDLKFRVIMEDGLFKVLSEKFSDVSRCLQIVEKMAEFQLQGFVRRP